MKLRMMLSALLFAAGIGFVAGCGDSSSSSSSGSSSGSKSEKGENFLKIVKESAMFKEASKEGLSDFKYEKTVKVYSAYVMVCGHGKIEGKGERPIAFHLKKKDGKWMVVEAEDNWGPKERYIDFLDFVKESKEFKEVSEFRYKKTVDVSFTYYLICGYAKVKGKGERQVAFHVKYFEKGKKENSFGEYKVVEWEDNWEPKDKYRK